MTNRPKNNERSILLNDFENEAVFNNLGSGCTTLCTGVVQLYLADAPNKQHWTKRYCGVMCFVKDMSKKSYFFRLYDLKNKQMLWEQEMYVNLLYKTPRDYFHSFEAHDCQAGLNFGSEDEAAKFKKVVMDKLMEKSQKRAEKKRQREGVPGMVPMSPAFNSNISGSVPPSMTANVQLNRPTTISTVKDTNVKKANIKGGKKKLTKEDISTPTDFRHVSHVGWDPNTGLDMQKLDPEMKALFEQIGINEHTDVDKETIEFIYDFVDRHGGILALKEDLAISVPNTQNIQQSRTPGTPNARPPPPPARVPGAPPPPGVRPGMVSPPPPPPSRLPASLPHGPPPRHPGGAPSMLSGNIPPPPPAPPVPIAPPPPDAPSVPGRAGLLADIHKGTVLKHVDSDPRGGLLNQIRSGTPLKPVDNSQGSAPRAPEAKGGIVGALALALAQRKTVIQGSDDEDSSDEICDDDDDDEWND